MTEPADKSPNRPTAEPRPLPFGHPESAEVRQAGPSKDRPRRSAPPVNAQRDRYWPRDGPVRWGALFTGAMKQVTLLVAIAAHGLLGLILVADLGLGLGPAGQGGAVADWAIAGAYAVLTVIVVRGWLFFRWSVILGPLVTLVLLALDGRFPFG